jgi:phospholipase/carboxylesterase
MSGEVNISQDPHASQPVQAAGEPLNHAWGAVLMFHGRGASAEDILALSASIAMPGVAYLAPQAAGNAWYPQPFTAPFASNEPWLSSALGRVSSLLGQVAQAGIPAERVCLLGFSQGACLALEYAARSPRRYGGIIGLSGGLIGPDAERRELDQDPTNPLAGTPVFLGCSDPDPFIPHQRVEASAIALRRLGGEVTQRFYPLMGHTVNQDEIDFIQAMLGALVPGG